MKYSQWIGILASIVLIAACFMPWTLYPDLNKEFTGFYSEGNAYGKPGKVFIVFAVVSIACFLIPKIWAKRGNFFIVAITAAYAIKSFIVFTACYKGICPEKRAGIWIMLGSTIVMLVMALLVPDLKKHEKINP